MNGEEMSTQQFDENGASVEADTVRALEAILMVAMEPVDPSLLAQLLEQPIEVVERLCAELASAYELSGHGFQLVNRWRVSPAISPRLSFLCRTFRLGQSGSSDLFSGP